MSITQTQNKNAPALRFPEFSGEYNSARLDERFKVVDCKHRTPPYVDDGIPIISPGSIRWGSLDLITPTKRVTRCEANSLMDHCTPSIGDLVFSRNQSLGVASYVDSEQPFVLGQDTVLITGKGGDRSLLYFSLQTTRIQNEISRISGGSTFSRINLKDIRALPLHFPTLPEQQKMASFLSSVDRKIVQLGKKKQLLEQYKKGCMQKLFSQELRFKDDQGHDFHDWEEKRLGYVTTSNDSGIYKKKELYGTGHNIVGVSDLFKTNSIDGQIFRHVPLSPEEIEENNLRAGDIIYAESSLVRKGIAKSVYVTEKGAGTAFAWHTRRFSLDSNVVNSAYVYYFLESDFARRYIESVATQTALTGITTKDYFKTPLLLPSLLEQQKIADLLSSIDRKIDLVATELDHAKTFKKGLLQQMFI